MAGKQREPPLNFARETEASLKEGVEIPPIGATIQDAIIICRRLRIRYLWVDALCILQDQRTDWLEKSSQISYIYGQPTVNLVSIVTNEASLRLLRRRKRNMLHPLESGRDTRRRSEPAAHPCLAPMARSPRLADWTVV